MQLLKPRAGADYSLNLIEGSIVGEGRGIDRRKAGWVVKGG